MVEMMQQNKDDDDGFQSFSFSKKKGSRRYPRLYVGNLPTSLIDVELKDKLVALFQERANISISKTNIQINNTQKSCHALITCSGNVAAEISTLVSKLHRTGLEGRRLVVQRERKRTDYGSSRDSTEEKKKKSSRPFGGSSWSKPGEDTNIRVDHSATSTPEQEEKIRQVISDEMHQSNDPVGTAVVSAAAVGVISALPPPSFQKVDSEDAAESGGDFMSRFCKKQPLSALLDEYGEQDLNWKQMIVPDDATAAAAAAPNVGKERTQTENRLGPQGKAPLHVEFTSFGYHYSAPAELRNNGWSHAQPLPVYDCRDDIDPVPPYLAWQDGLSGHIRRVLLHPNKNNNNSTPKDQTSIRQLANDIATKTATALVDAIEHGGHGYALPLKMVVYVGSELGRHRSVVLCELAATALRKQLRENDMNCFAQPCSVGTRHRDLERRSNNNTKGQQSRSSSSWVRSSKQREFEDD